MSRTTIIKLIAAFVIVSAMLAPAASAQVYRGAARERSAGEPDIRPGRRESGRTAPHRAASTGATPRSARRAR